MTDEQIIKALECCMNSSSREDCEDLNCPACEKHGCYFNNISEEDYPEVLIEGISISLLDLINRQKAEIERLQGYNENLQTANTALSNEILDIKTEAIKEFWKRFDKVLCENIGPSKRVYWKISSEGNNLVKEMTEGGVNNA